jgi:SH3-like domain-containing protein
MKVNKNIYSGLFILAMCSIAMLNFALAPAHAYDPKEGSGLPVPRFVSIKSDNAFVRTGPSMDYPIKFVFKREGLPVQIIQEFDAWRKIKDPSGETGWVHKLLLSGKRTAMITSDSGAPLFRKADASTPIMRLEKNVIVTAKECDSVWCNVDIPYKADITKGWIMQKNIWGIAETEKFN